MHRVFSPPDTELTLRWWRTARGLQHALILARAQVARTMSPHFGDSWTQHLSENGKQRWDLHFYSGGPGHAKIGSVIYLVDFHGGRAEPAWLPLGDALILLNQHGMDTDNDFALSWVGRAPLVPQSKAEDGFLLLAATPQALAEISRLEIQITATDAVGDHHTLLIRAAARLPLQSPETSRGVTSPAPILTSVRFYPRRTRHARDVLA